MLRIIRAIGIAIVVVAAGAAALAVGEKLRDARAQQMNGNALANVMAATPPASASPTVGRPLTPVALPADYAASTARIAPDGRSLVVISSDYKRLAMFEIPAAGAPILRGTTASSAGEWLPDSSGYVIGVYLPPTPTGPRNSDGAIATMKQQTFSVFERNGSFTALGTGWQQSHASPDSRWIPVIDDCCPSPIRLLDRSGGPARLLTRVDAPDGLFILGWGPGERLLYTQGHRLFAIDIAGATREIVAPVPTATRTPTYSYLSTSPDGSAALVQALGGSGQPATFAVTGTGTVALSSSPYGGAWIGPHELLASTETRFVGVDALSGKQRELAIPARPRSDAFVGISAPYVLWIDESKTGLHLADVRIGGDRPVELGWMPANWQVVQGGRMFLVRDNGALILDGERFLAPQPAASPTR